MDEENFASHDGAEQPAPKQVSHLLLYQQLGDLQGSLRTLGSDLRGLGGEMRLRWAKIDEDRVEDARQFATLKAEVRELRQIVDRIKKPVEAFISLRNLLIGILTLIALVGGAWGYFSGWLGAIFHPSH